MNVIMHSRYWILIYSKLCTFTFYKCNPQWYPHALISWKINFGNVLKCVKLLERLGPLHVYLFLSGTSLQFLYSFVLQPSTVRNMLVTFWSAFDQFHVTVKSPTSPYGSHCRKPFRNRRSSCRYHETSAWTSLQ